MKKMLALVCSLALAFMCGAVFAEGNGTATDADQEDVIFTEMVTATIDLSHYEQKPGGLTSDHMLERAILKAEVGGKTLELGMPFEEVLAAGFIAPDGFAGREFRGRLSTKADFLTEDGKIVSMGFIGSVDGDKLSDSVLYSIHRQEFREENPADMSIEGISVGSNLPALIETLGNPTTIVKDGHSLCLRYECSDDAALETVTFWIGIDGKVTGLRLEGRLKS